MRNSFVELNARERAFILLDNQEGRELLGPFDHFISPHLVRQNIVPESDDGVVIVKGKMKGNDVAIISIEGKFQGGGIGEVSGAKIASALEEVLKDNQRGETIYPIIILDTGGVRLQEANYGLLSISEIGNMIVAIKEYVPVVGLVPGLVGSFGGMSITSALMSYLIATPKARIGLNGPEVIEQEAGVMEFDASDKELIWETIGARQRLKIGIIDELVKDDIYLIKDSINQAIEEKKDVKRTVKYNEYLTLLSQYNPSQKLTIEEYNRLFNVPFYEEVEMADSSEGVNIKHKSRGYKWFEALTGINHPTSSSISTVLSHVVEKNNQPYAYISVVPDSNNPFYRVRHGEMGLVEGFAVAKKVNEWVKEDEEKDTKRPIILIIDVPSQAYGYNEELVGIHLSLASSAESYAKARQKGHPVIGVIVGNAISGAFLAHGLQSNRLIALNDTSINVQAMSKESAARITNRTLEELEKATEKVPAMAYDIVNFNQLGALYQLVDGIDGDDFSNEEVNRLEQIIDEAIASTKNAPKDLSFRYQTKEALREGRIETNKVRKEMMRQWNQ